MMNQANDIDDILEQKLKACKDFFLATNLLKQALETEGMVSVDSLIRRRGELMQTIDSLDRRIIRFRRQYPLNHTHAIAKLFRELEGILKQIIFANQSCVSVAAGKCEGLKKDMAIVRQTGAGIHGYSRGTQRVQKFLDIEM